MSGKKTMPCVKLNDGISECLEFGVGWTNQNQEIFLLGVNKKTKQKTYKLEIMNSDCTYQNVESKKKVKKKQEFVVHEKARDGTERMKTLYFFHSLTVNLTVREVLCIRPSTDWKDERRWRRHNLEWDLSSGFQRKVSSWDYWFEGIGINYPCNTNLHTLVYRGASTRSFAMASATPKLMVLYRVVVFLQLGCQRLNPAASHPAANSAGACWGWRNQQNQVICTSQGALWVYTQHTPGSAAAPWDPTRTCEAWLHTLVSFGWGQHPLAHVLFNAGTISMVYIAVLLGQKSFKPKIPVMSSTSSLWWLDWYHITTPTWAYLTSNRLHYRLPINISTCPVEHSW